jgi:Two component regulator propeller
MAHLMRGPACSGRRFPPAVAWRLLLAAVLCIAAAHSALSQEVPIWANFTTENSDLPNNSVYALAVGADGALWVGTFGYGLARLDRSGEWRTYSKDATHGGLPGNTVMALAPGADGALWVGTDGGGLARFHLPPAGTIRIVDMIGKAGEVSQAEQTIAVVAFDGSYLTPPGMFHYLWTLTERGLLGGRPGTEVRTLSPVYKASFDHDGSYRLSVTAIGRYGDRSEPKDIDFQVTLPKPQTLWDRLLARWPAVLAAMTGLYACGFIALLFLSRYRAWAFRALSDAAWAAWLTWPFFFLRHVPLVQRWVLEPWFQAVRRGALADVPFLDPPVFTGGGAPSEATALLRRLDKQRRLWLHGRSGMGKSSVFAAWGRAYYAAKEDQPDRRGALLRLHPDHAAVA